MIRKLWRVRVAVKAEVSAYVMATTADEAEARVAALMPVELLQLPRPVVSMSIAEATPATAQSLWREGWVNEPPFYPHAEHRVVAGADPCAAILIELEELARLDQVDPVESSRTDGGLA